jgi:hypothetical protein
MTHSVINPKIVNQDFTFRMNLDNRSIGNPNDSISSIELFVVSFEKKTKGVSNFHGDNDIVHIITSDKVITGTFPQYAVEIKNIPTDIKKYLSKEGFAFIVLITTNTAKYYVGPVLNQKPVN